MVEERSPSGAIPQASFIYINSEKYHGEIQYKVVNPDITTLWILPSSLVSLKNSLDYLAGTALCIYMDGSSNTLLCVSTINHLDYKSSLLNFGLF